MTHVDIPLEFSLDQIFNQANHNQDDSRTKYHLYAIISHKGDYLEAGHYIALIRDLEVNKDKWYLYNDSIV